MEILLDKLLECKLEVDKITFDDDTALLALLNRTKMYMSKLRPNSITIKELNPSLFKASLIRDVMFGSNEGAFRKSWEEGKIRFKNYIDYFIEEYQLDSELKINEVLYDTSKSQTPTYHIGQINANGGIVTLGNVNNSTQKIDDSIKHSENLIEQKGGTEK